MPSTLTNDDLARLQTLYDQATPGRWGPGPGYVTLENNGTFSMYWDGDDEEETYPQSFKDAAFIAAAHKAMPALLKVAQQPKLLIWTEIPNGHKSKTTDGYTLIVYPDEEGWEWTLFGPDDNDYPIACGTCSMGNVDSLDLCKRLAETAYDHLTGTDKP